MGSPQAGAQGTESRRRKKVKSRKQIANDLAKGVGRAPAKHIPKVGAVQVEEPWWVAQGLFAIETCSGNSWQSLRGAVLSRSKADIESYLQSH